MSELALIVLGGIQVRAAGSVVRFRTRKAAALLVYLAIEGGMHTRDTIVDLLWPESGPEQGRAMLRSTIAWVRAAWRRAGSRADVFVTYQGAIGLNPELSLSCDVQSLERAVRQIEVPSARAVGDHGAQMGPDLLGILRAADAAYRGDFLDGFVLGGGAAFDDWAAIQRERRHRQREVVIEQLVVVLRAAGMLRAAIEAAARWVAHAPLSEPAHHALIALYLELGDQAAARRALSTCRKVLWDELGLEPSDEILALERRSDLGVSGERRASAAPRASESDARHQLSSGLLHRLPHTAVSDGPQLLILEHERMESTRMPQADLDSWARQRGADLMRGRAIPTLGGAPYYLIAQALAERLERERAPVDLLPDVWLSELSRLLPELRDRYPDLPPPLSGDDAARQRLAEAVIRLTLALAQRSPLVLVLEDLHLADDLSLDLLLLATRRWAAQRARVLLIVTVTANTLQSDQRLQAWVATIAGEVPVRRAWSGAEEELLPVRLGQARQRLDRVPRESLPGAAIRRSGVVV